MSKRNKPQSVNWRLVLDLLELRQAVSLHCTALKGVIALLEVNNRTAAIARLDGAVSVLMEACFGLVADLTIPCPSCGSEQGVRAWCEDHKCGACTADLWPERPASE
jgi:hypothetical protein